MVSSSVRGGCGLVVVLYPRDYIGCKYINPPPRLNFATHDAQTLFRVPRHVFYLDDI